MVEDRNYDRGEGNENRSDGHNLALIRMNTSETKFTLNDILGALDKNNQLLEELIAVLQENK